MKNIFEQYPVIKFEDIRKGDTLAAVTHNQNAFDAMVGTVDVKDNHGTFTTYWYTEGGKREIVNDAAHFYPVIIHLIDRPKPELPTEIGKAIYIKKYDGEVLETPVLAVKFADEDFCLPTVDIHKHAVFSSVWIAPRNFSKIEEFTLAEVKEVTA